MVGTEFGPPTTIYDPIQGEAASAWPFGMNNSDAWPTPDSQPLARVYEHPHRSQPRTTSAVAVSIETTGVADPRIITNSSHTQPPGLRTQYSNDLNFQNTSSARNSTKMPEPLGFESGEASSTAGQGDRAGSVSGVLFGLPGPVNKHASHSSDQRSQTEALRNESGQYVCIADPKCAGLVFQRQSDLSLIHISEPTRPY